MSHTEQGPLAGYNSLSDSHLAGFFANTRIRRHLIKAGLVTRRGEIISESSFRLNAARKEHKKYVKDLLAQAIVHKTLDLERHRQVQIRKTLEEIAKIELVRRIRGEKNDSSNESLLPYLSQSEAECRRAQSSSRESSRRDLVYSSRPRSRNATRSVSPTQKRNRRAQEKCSGDEDILPLLSPRPRIPKSRPQSGSARKFSLQKYQRTRPASAPSHIVKRPPSPHSYIDDGYRTIYVDEDGQPVAPSPGPDKSQNTRPVGDNSFDPSKEELDSRHLYSLDTTALRKYASAISRHEHGHDAISPYLLPQMSYPVPTPPKTPRTQSRASTARLSRPRSVRSDGGGQRSSRQRPWASSLQRHHSEGVVLDKDDRQSPTEGSLTWPESTVQKRQTCAPQGMCFVTMKYHGKTLSLPHDQVDPYQQISIDQQHCGGNTLCVFYKRILPGTFFRFVSKRHHGYPFSMTLFIDGLIDCRVSACCEYKHTAGARIGGSHGHFSITEVSGTEPCFRCRYEKEMKEKERKKKRKLREAKERKREMEEEVTAEAAKQHVIKQEEPVDDVPKIVIPVEDSDLDDTDNGEITPAYIAVEHDDDNNVESEAVKGADGYEEDFEEDDDEEAKVKQSNVESTAKNDEKEPAKDATDDNMNDFENDDYDEQVEVRDVEALAHSRPTGYDDDDFEKSVSSSSRSSSSDRHSSDSSSSSDSEGEFKPSPRKRKGKKKKSPQRSSPIPVILGEVPPPDRAEVSDAEADAPKADAPNRQDNLVTRQDDAESEKGEILELDDETVNRIDHIFGNLDNVRKIESFSSDEDGAGDAPTNHVTVVEVHHESDSEKQALEIPRGVSDTSDAESISITKSREKPSTDDEESELRYLGDTEDTSTLVTKREIIGIGSEVTTDTAAKQDTEKEQDLAQPIVISVDDEATEVYSDNQVSFRENSEDGMKNISDQIRDEFENDAEPDDVVVIAYDELTASESADKKEGLKQNPHLELQRIPQDEATRFANPPQIVISGEDTYEPMLAIAETDEEEGVPSLMTMSSSTMMSVESDQEVIPEERFELATVENKMNSTPSNITGDTPLLEDGLEEAIEAKRVEKEDAASITSSSSSSHSSSSTSSLSSHSDTEQRKYEIDDMELSLTINEDDAKTKATISNVVVDDNNDRFAGTTELESVAASQDIVPVNAETVPEDIPISVGAADELGLEKADENDDKQTEDETKENKYNEVREEEKEDDSDDEEIIDEIAEEKDTDDDDDEEDQEIVDETEEEDSEEELEEDNDQDADVGEQRSGGRDPDNIIEGQSIGQVLESRLQVAKPASIDGDVIQKLSSQDVISLTNTALSKSQVNSLSEFLRSNDGIVEISLNNCELDDLDIHKLLEGVKASPSKPMVLNLSNNRFGPDVVEYITPALSQKPSIEMLILTSNPLGDDGVEILTRDLIALSAKSSVTGASPEEEEEESKMDVLVNKTDLPIPDDAPSTSSGSVEGFVGADNVDKESVQSAESTVLQDQDYVSKHDLIAAHNVAESIVSNALQDALHNDRKIIDIVKKLESALPHGRSLSLTSEDGENAEINRKIQLSVLSESNEFYLKELDLGNTKITDVGAAKIKDLLHANLNIESISLAGNQEITLSGWKAISGGLRKNNKLIRLTLDYCNLGNDGFAELADAIKDNSTLRSLDLECTGLTEDGGVMVVNLLKRNTTLTDVNIMPGNSISEGTVDEVKNYLALNQNFQTRKEY